MVERVTKLRDLIGVMKDKASASKAALLSKPNTLPLHLAVLRATTHSSSTPPDAKHLAALLSLGDSSRATASALVESLMDRLNGTGDASVALKCLLTIHHIIKRGPFILQDQLSVFPAFGGRNHLKLSGFRDGATATTWALSAWVRWYARYLETLLSTSRVLGFFLSSSSFPLEKDNQDEILSSFTNRDLIGDVNSLVGLIEEICKAPDSLLLQFNKQLLDEVMRLVSGDYLTAVNEVLSRLSEFMERLSCLSFGESVELICALKRLEERKEIMGALFDHNKPPTEALWGVIGELKNMLGLINVYREGGKLASVERGEKGSESARFGDRVMKFGDSVSFSSARFDVSKVLEYVQPTN